MQLMSSWQPNQNKNRFFSVREIRQGITRFQEVLMEESTHSREGRLPRNRPNKAKEKELEQVETTSLETEMASQSPSWEMGMEAEEVEAPEEKE